MQENEVYERVRDALARLEPSARCACSSPAKAAAARGALPRATATTTCAFSTSTGATGISPSRKRRDVIEQPLADDLDVSGWDLRKALGCSARATRRCSSG